MGCFDSLYFKCPNCGEKLEEQTKSGPCMLDGWDIDDPKCPLWMLMDMEGVRGECYKCGKPYLIDIKTETKILSRKVIPLDNLDYVAWHGNDEEPWTEEDDE